MSDEFRRTLDIYCGVGGVKCYCCNQFKAGKKRKRLRRMARRRLKVVSMSDWEAANNVPEDELYDDFD